MHTSEWFRPLQLKWFSSPLVPISLCSSAEFASTGNQLAGILQKSFQLSFTSTSPGWTSPALPINPKQSLVSGTVNAKEWLKHHGTTEGLKQRWLMNFNCHHSPMVHQAAALSTIWKHIPQQAVWKAELPVQVMSIYSFLQNYSDNSATRRCNRKCHCQIAAAA